MDQETGVMDTIAPSEPILAKEAMEHICQKDNRSLSIRILTEELLQNGLIDKGIKGELYSHFILILAHDYLLSGRSLGSAVVQCIYAVLRRGIFAVDEADGEEPFSVVLERQISYFADEDGL
ncbi:hypothetical protein V8E54_005408 [Elaphomyces granulatus]